MSVKDLLTGMRIANEERDRLERMGLSQEQIFRKDTYLFKPIPPEMDQLFAPWGGRVSGIIADPLKGIEVKYESGTEVTFIVASTRT